MITLKYSLFMSNPRRNVTRLDSRIYRAKLFAAPRGKLFDTLHFLTAVNLLLRGLIFIPSHQSKIFFQDSDLGGSRRARCRDRYS